MSEVVFPASVPISGRVRICLEYIKTVDLKNKTLVDIGSSFGWLEKELISEGLKEIVGIEMNEMALKFAKKTVKGVNFLLGNALNLPVQNNFADYAVFYDVIEHVPQGTETQSLKEINRVLKKGGKLFLSTPNKNLFSNIFDIAWYFGHRHYSQRRLRNLLIRSGFKILKIESRGSIFSSLYLAWFYVMKIITGKQQPRNRLFEKLDDIGYANGNITDIFVIAQKK